MTSRAAVTAAVAYAISAVLGIGAGVWLFDLLAG
jgi:hypothetical protein